MSFRVKCAAALITIASAAPLAAQQNYNFQFTDSSNALLLSGTLTTDPTVNDLILDGIRRVLALHRKRMAKMVARAPR